MTKKVVFERMPRRISSKLPVMAVVHILLKGPPMILVDNWPLWNTEVVVGEALSLSQKMLEDKDGKGWLWS